VRPGSFGAELLELREGGADYAEFARRTREVWRRFARYLERRWRLPLGIDTEDVEQELLVAGWVAVNNWDPARGVEIDRYVRFNAIDKAKKWIHKQRDSYRRDGSAPSRAPTVFSAFERPDDEAGSAQDRLAWVPPDAEDRLTLPEDRPCRWQRDRRGEIAHFFSQARAVAAFRERECLDLLTECGGDVELAADRILADPGLSLALRIGSDEDALAAVRHTITWAINTTGNSSNGGPET
jgi:hypothetical protein